jgi:hypothetical protein
MIPIQGISTTYYCLFLPRDSKTGRLPWGKCCVMGLVVRVSRVVGVVDILSPLQMDLIPQIRLKPVTTAHQPHTHLKTHLFI